jgi:3-isopropylmalate/(R)-2-methylmalate dehydratase large subunit
MAWQGSLPDGVCAKDMMLHMIGRFGMNGGAYQAVEFAGSTVRGMGMAERMTLSNMSAELGAQVGLVAPDTTTIDWLASMGVPRELATADGEHWQTDEGAEVELHEFDAKALAPMVAAPHSPANSHPVSDLAGQGIDLAYVGACTGAKLEDLQAAARVLRGRRVASGVRLLVAPASLRDLAAARDQGLVDDLQDAGAEFLPSACGACAGYGQAIQGRTRVMATTARNFKGRMGSAEAEVFLASPYSVAASALKGRITDPREVLP